MARIFSLFIIISLSVLVGCHTSTTPSKQQDTEGDNFGEFLGPSTFQFYPQENFDVAEFRLWVPKNTADLRATLILLDYNNSNGLNMVYKAGWQKFATKERLALVGVHFKSVDNEGEHYALAGLGSGFALTKAIDTLAVKNDLQKLKYLPFLIRGYSAGGTHPGWRK